MQDTLTLTLEKSSKKIIICAELGNESKEYQLERSAEEILEDFTKLYGLLEKKSPKENKIKALFATLGEEFFNPISALMDAASHVEFVIPDKFIRCTPDFLYLGESHLFMQKVITYRFDGKPSNHKSFSTDWSALLVSDKTADPDDGVRFVSRVLPSSTYYDMRSLNSDILGSAKEVDVLVISGHGNVGDEKTDYIQMNEERIRPDDLTHLSPKLVYLDSCQLGISRDFIDAFRSCGVSYYLAPVLSNEAGESSTRTIHYFFKALQEGTAPAQALFLTRHELYKHYRNNAFSTLIERAFPFRLYHL